ncbi:hypothetical protein BS17DRAFT_699963 [Gyrodon lividus]|nr:hypothetical protein BS17DRAFT_699963 [Gyrodon lividus]
MAQTSLFALASLISGASSTFAGSATFTATCTPLDVPYHAGQRQSGYSQCGTGYNQTSECYNAFLNTVQDFCLWGPPLAGLNWAIGNTEQIEVPWCMKSGHGTRLIPDGTITGAHLVVTPDYVQITGVGNLTNINIPAGDAGGKLGPHGANGQGNQVSGLVFSSAFGQLEQIHEWTSFVSYNQFCFRACKPSATTSTMCQYIDGVVGCEWNMPGNYDVGVFENCLGDSAEPIGVHGTSTFYQGASATPEPHPISIPSSSSCTTHSTISNEQVILERDVTSTDNSNESTPITVRSHWHSGTNRHRAASVGSSGAAAPTAPLIGWEKLMLTIFAVVVGSSIGALVVL